MADNMVLYFKPDCTYCVRTIYFIEKNGIEMELRNIYEGDNQLQLMSVAGSGQVPCLIVDGEPIFDDEEIVAYLAERFGIQQ